LDDGEDQFVYLRRPDPQIHFKVSTILSERWQQSFRRLPAYKFRHIKDCRRRILSYRLPFIFAETRELADVRETFIASTPRECASPRR